MLNTAFHYCFSRLYQRIFRTPCTTQLILKSFAKITIVFSIPQDVSMMPPCVTSAMSVGNLNQVRDGNDTSTVSQSNNNNSINSSNNNNNKRVSNAISAGNVSKIHTAKVTGKLNARFTMCFLRVQAKCQILNVR